MAKPKMDYKIEVPKYVEGYINVWALNAPQLIERIAGIEGVAKVSLLSASYFLIHTSPLYDRDEIAKEAERAISIPDVFLKDSDDAT